jgi:hypothetical protein
MKSFQRTRSRLSRTRVKRRLLEVLVNRGVPGVTRNGVLFLGVYHGRMMTFWSAHLRRNLCILNRSLSASLLAAAMYIQFLFIPSVSCPVLSVNDPFNTAP